MALLKAENISYFYEGTSKGVRNISFSGKAGDLIAVVGKNGAGKSTLLNMLSGLYLPQNGQIVCAPDLNYHDLGISTQKQSIDWYLNVYDNILLGAMLAGLSRKEAHIATASIAKILDLSDLYERSPDSLSGGQQQRIQVARALVHNPKIVILDEPTAGLDYLYSHRLFDFLRIKCLKEQRLIFVSSHDLTMLENYCNKILFLDNGTQLYFGEMDSFLNSHDLSKAISISFSGDISENLRKTIVSKDVTFDGQTVVINNADSNNINKIIKYLLQEVSIIGIDSKQVGLKEIISQTEGKNNA